MRATHWLMGFALCIAGIGSAAAASMDTQDMDGSSHASSESSSSHETCGGGGDAIGVGRDCAQHSGAADPAESPAGSVGNPHEHIGGAIVAPAPSQHPPHLGWQSLLPGSIQ